ncbi:GGDEF domain-containing protein [Salinispirillum sp. LH 10-3-1]|uniref:diguanylate cyclase n=1 Tax=Salinispirillum sp. LH 10-3-1 TaxID=2952525 RepID=A0AB38YFH7_9GAMM
MWCAERQIGLLLVVLWLVLPKAFGNALEPVVLQLPWHHQFQFAGYYAAQSRGYFTDAGLDVEIRNGFHPSGAMVNTVEEVVFERAQFGVGRSELMIHHGRGLPIKVLANILQRSPLVFMTLEEYNLTRLEDIGDRPISLTLPTGRSGEIIAAETLAALNSAGVDYRTLNNRPPTWNMEDLISGVTQLMPGFATDDPYVLAQRGVTPVSISPTEYGVDFYGDMLFTSQYQARNNPETVSAFRAAALKGWRYALQNPQEMAALIISEYGTRGPDYDLAFLLQEAAQMKEFMQPDLIEVGYINPERWTNIAELYLAQGLIDRYSLEDFLYQDAPVQLTLREQLPWILGASLLLLAILGVALWLHLTNLQLVLEVRQRERVESRLRYQAEKDALTGLDNRYQFHQRIEDDFTQARQTGAPLSVMMLDIDHFKQINDTHGHLAGDRVLQEIARLCQEEIRATDLVCRYGGEEFAFVLLHTPIEVAVLIAARIAAESPENPVEYDGKSIACTVSIGLAELTDEDSNAEALLKRADTNLYQAKANGRNQIFY